MPVIPSNQPQQPTIQPEQQPLGKREAGSGFTNISQILGANINKPTGLSAGTQMGQQIGSSIGNQAGQVRTGVEQSAQAFKSNYDLARNQALGAISGASQYIDPNAVAAATSTTTATTGTTPSTETTGAAAPSPIVKAATPVTAQTTTTTTPYATTVLPSGLSGLSAADAQAIGKNLSGAAYTGPTGLANQAVLAGQAQSLKDIGKYAMSGSLGQQELLRSMVATPGTYTKGQSQLDRALLAQSQAGQKAIQSGAQQALQTQQGVINQQNIASNLASQAASNIASQVGQTKAGLISTLGGVQQAGINSASDYVANANRVNDILSGKVLTSDLTDSDKALLANAQQYGIDTSIRVDPRNAAYMSQFLSSIGGSIPLAAQSGQKYYTPEQQAAVQNLATITGGTPETITPFNTNLFNLNQQNVQSNLGYKAMTDADKTALQAKQDELNKMYYQNLDLMPLGGRDAFFSNKKPKYEATKNYQDIYENLKRDPSMGGEITPENKDYFSKIDQLADVLNKNITAEKQAQYGQTLQDYINQKFGSGEYNVAGSQIPGITAGQAGLTDKFGRPIG